MKTSLLLGSLGALLLAGCVITPPAPPTVAVQTVAPEPVYRPGYVVTTLPTGYRTMRYGRSVYYVNRGVYYRRHPSGYVVVTRPY